MIPLECYTNLDGLAVLDSNDCAVLYFIKCHNIFKNLFFLHSLPVNQLTSLTKMRQ